MPPTDSCTTRFWRSAAVTPRHGAGAVGFRWPVGLVVLLLMVASSLVGALPAGAAPADKVDSWRIDYRVDDQGLLHVSETLVWRFGDSSGRHGIDRELVTREPFKGANGAKDAVYGITDIKVSGPNSDAGPEITDSCLSDNRNCTKRIRIGDPSRTVSTPTATYTISYVVSGALRHFGDHDELYWDVVSIGTPFTDSMRVEVSVPGGAQQVACYAGYTGSTQSCTSASTSGGRAVFTQTPRPHDEMLTIVVAIGSGLVADNQPHLENARMSEVARGSVKGGVIGVIAAVVMGTVVWATKRRYVDDPPPSEKTSPTASGDSYRQPPTAPDVPAVLGEFLLDREVGSRTVAAELVDLAVRGIVRLGDELGDGTTKVRLVNPHLPKEPWEEKFIQAVFRGRLGRGNDIVTLDRNHLAEASLVVSAAVNQIAAERGLVKQPGRKRPGLVVLTLLLPVLVALLGMRSFAVLQFFRGNREEDLYAAGAGMFLAFIVLVLGITVIQGRVARPYWTSVGSAAAAQVRAYRNLLLWGKSDQMAFDPSRDDFSELLPRAIAVGQAESWAKLCSGAGAGAGAGASGPFAGQRLPGWYLGDLSTFDSGRFIVPLASGMTGNEPTGGFFSGGGGGSSHSSGFSGGSSGGGGGGGGASSW